MCTPTTVLRFHRARCPGDATAPKPRTQHPCCGLSFWTGAGLPALTRSLLSIVAASKTSFRQETASTGFTPDRYEGGLTNAQADSLDCLHLAGATGAAL